MKVIKWRLSEDSKSSKGLKAGTEITINEGNIDISSTDDSIHSNGIIIINDGTIKLSSRDDGIHADTNIVINNGTIDIIKSYEGIESGYIEINGGTGKEISSFKTEKAYGIITISNANIEKGETYSLYVNGTNVGNLEVNSIITSNSASNGMGMQQNKGGQPRGDF